jgi:GSH-dependent disulfide-bond oxidoreductase
MLTLFDFDASPSCLKVKILLKELGVAFEQRSLTRADLRGSDYRSKFPTGQAPAIQDGELSLAESQAIALYLAEKHGQFLPSDPARRALMHQALSIEAALVAPTIGGQGLFGEVYKPAAEQNAPRLAELRREAVRVGQILGELLGDKPYFADELSVADFQLYPPVSKALAAGAFGAPPANLVAWCARIAARPCVQAARQEYVHYRDAVAAA